jgi:hypothetical protein
MVYAAAAHKYTVFRDIRNLRIIPFIPQIVNVPVYIPYTGIKAYTGVRQPSLYVFGVAIVHLPESLCADAC